MTVKEAAAVLGISEASLRAVVRAGRIGHYRLGGTAMGRVTFAQAHLDEYRAACEFRPRRERAAGAGRRVSVPDLLGE